MEKEKPGRPKLTLIKGDGPTPDFQKRKPLISSGRGAIRDQVLDALRSKTSIELIEDGDAQCEILLQYLREHPSADAAQEMQIERLLENVVTLYLGADAMDRLEDLERELKGLGRTAEASHVAEMVRTSSY